MMVVMYASQQAVSPKVHVMHADAAKKPTKITETELLNSTHCEVVLFSVPKIPH